jgi:hypothetical protein
MTITLAQAVIGVGAFGLLLVVLYGPWQAICTDFTRQILFEKRDAIFDLAQAGRLSFDSPEYGTIRSSLQSQIRFAHELTLPRFFVLRAAILATGELPPKSDLARAVERIHDPGTRSEVHRLVTQAHPALFVMMCLKSPMMIILLPALLIVLAALAIAHRARRTVKGLEHRAAIVIQAEADSLPT